MDTTFTAQDISDIQSIFGVEISDLQEDVAIDSENHSITGTSKYVASVNTFDMRKGHHFIALHIADEDADELKASMDPTQSSLTTLDESGVIILQMKDAHDQAVKIVKVKDGDETEYLYSVENMTFAEQA